MKHSRYCLQSSHPTIPIYGDHEVPNASFLRCLTLSILAVLRHGTTHHGEYLWNHIG